MKLQGKIALVTGATRGIGEAIARGLAREGAQVLVGCRSRPDGEKVAKALGGGAEALVIDVGEPESIAAAAKEVEGRHGQLHALSGSLGLHW